MKCNNCEMKFDKPLVKVTTQGTIFGVPSINEPKIEIEVCPYCGSDEIEREEK